ncbi:MAG: dienelactone hydrolase family protein [Armatimonadota bacterium]
MSGTIERDVKIPSGGMQIQGTLILPEGATAVVLFAHGSGSGRFSPRNQYVASVLREKKLGTLLIDLLAEWEADVRLKVFDIELLAQRLLSATSWLQADPYTRPLPIGYFGASTGAAAALIASTKRKNDVCAIVSRGGRPDLALEFLPKVTVPVQLIVGGDDDVVIVMNEQAYALLPGIKEMKIIPGATHLFEEPGALEEVARLASEWFAKYLIPDRKK